jgi:hypothetical protein
MPVARPSGAFVRNVVVQVGADVVDPTLGDRSGELPRVEPHPPCHQLRAPWVAIPGSDPRPPPPSQVGTPGAWAPTGDDRVPARTPLCLGHFSDVDLRVLGHQHGTGEAGLLFLT